MTSQQQRMRNFSIDSFGGERTPDESFYQGMLKAMDDRKGINMFALSGNDLYLLYFTHHRDQSVYNRYNGSN